MKQPLLVENRPKIHLSPLYILILFTIINTVTYVDRGLFSASLDTIESAYSLDNTLGGLLGTSYIIGYCIASIVFAHLSGLYKPLPLMCVGLIIWAVSVVGTGLAPNFTVMMIARMITGVGEASFVCLAPPFIDILSPVESRSSWLACFYVAIPFGYAIGFVGGGVGISMFGGWKWLFLIVAILMGPLVFAALRIKGPNSLQELALEHNLTHEHVHPTSTVQFSPRKESDSDSTVNPSTPTYVAPNHEIVDKLPTPCTEKYDPIEFSLISEYGVDGHWGRFISEMKALYSNYIYVAVVLGYAANTFVTGAFAYFGMQFIQEQYGLKKTEAGYYFGGLSVVTGVIGSGCGGYILDRLRNNNPERKGEVLGELESTSVALYFISIVAALALPICIVPFLTVNIYLFFVCVGLAQLLCFTTMSPTNSILLWCVEMKHRPMAMAACVMFTHILGDALSPVLLGAIKDHTHSWNTTMLIAASWLTWNVLFYFLAYRKSVFNLKRKDSIVVI